MLTVICLNCLLAALVGWLTYRLWGCRRHLAHLSVLLQSPELSSQWTPQQLSYQLALKRVQIVQTRLGVALWQRRSQQIRQVLRAIAYLQLLLRYRAKQRRETSHKGADARYSGK